MVRAERGRLSKILYICVYNIVLVTCCVRVAVCGWTGFASGGVCAMVMRERSRKRSERKEVFFRRVCTYNNNILRCCCVCDVAEAALGGTQNGASV